MEIMRVLLWLTIGLIIIVAAWTWLNARRSAIVQSPKTPYKPTSPDRAYKAPSSPDDLTQINGIGPVIQKKLRGLKITTYDQIAAFTPADIERVSKVLSFQGRVERENWVEQAMEFVKARRIEQRAN